MPRRRGGSAEESHYRAAGRLSERESCASPAPRGPCIARYPGAAPSYAVLGRGGGEEEEAEEEDECFAAAAASRSALRRARWPFDGESEGDGGGEGAESPSAPSQR